MRDVTISASQKLKQSVWMEKNGFLNVFRQEISHATYFCLKFTNIYKLTKLLVKD